MAREIVVLCDPCLAEDVRSTGRTIEIAIEGKSRSVELCETHEAEIVKPLLDVLGRFGSRITVAPRSSRSAAASPVPVSAEGQRLGKPPAGPRQLVCIACGADYASSSGLALHMTAKHGAPERGALSWAHGDRCPLCGLTCAAGRLGSHAGTVHSTGTAQVFTAARDAGDEFGVVAERVAILTSAR